MSGQEWTPYVVIFAMAALVMWRLDRLGKQVEAVRDHLLLELGNEETKSETSRARMGRERADERTTLVLDLLVHRRAGRSCLVRD